MDDGPDYYDVGWFRDSPSEIWGENNGLEELGWFGAILQIIILLFKLLHIIVFLPFWIIIYLPFLIIMGIGKLFSSGSGDEDAKKEKPKSNSIYTQNTQTNNIPKTVKPAAIVEEKKQPVPVISTENIWEKKEAERKEFLEKLEANLKKDMSESAYWQKVPQDKRDRQISRYIKEAKLDLKNLGIEKASKLWLGFIKKSDAKRDSHPCPPPV
jgi:hypothetical protein